MRGVDVIVSVLSAPQQSVIPALQALEISRQLADRVGEVGARIHLGISRMLRNEKGESQDGFVRLHEIYNLKLPADLVVLSACQTGLGKEIKGEGLIGLTRGFMYAGAARVVASLWRVNDYATAELMKRFYKGMLKENLRPAAALRAAQIEMWKQKRFAAPYHWAAFTLQGEWK